jgi:hypothetical protein
MKDILGKRKTRESGKRMILKGMQVISTIEFYEKIKICEEATKKKMPTGRPRGRPRKNVSISSEIIVEENTDEEDEDEDEDLE